jgi:hypothetical protein
MKAYQCRNTGLWKWGTRGEYQFSTRDEAYKYGMEKFAEAMKRLRERQNQIGQNHGRAV